MHRATNPSANVDDKKGESGTNPSARSVGDHGGKGINPDDVDVQAAPYPG